MYLVRYLIRYLLGYLFGDGLRLPSPVGATLTYAPSAGVSDRELEVFVLTIPMMQSLQSSFHSVGLEQGEKSVVDPGCLLMVVQQFVVITNSEITNVLLIRMLSISQPPPKTL